MDGKTCIRVLIADPHAVVREGIVATLSRQDDMRVVGEASNIQETRELFRLLRPDVAVMELGFPDGDGRDMIAALRREFPAACILVLTIQQGDNSIYTALQAGARGYLFKDVSPSTVTEAIRALHAGRKALNARVTAKLVGRLHQTALTLREREILGLMVAGKSNKEIAHTLSITEGTVKAHVNRILAKLEVNGRTEAVVSALERGFVFLR